MSKQTVPSVSGSHFKEALTCLHTPQSLIAQPEPCDKHTGSFPGMEGGRQLVLELAGLFLPAPHQQGAYLQPRQCPCCCQMVLAAGESQSSTLFILKEASLFDSLKHSIWYSRPIFLNFYFFIFLFYVQLFICSTKETVLHIKKVILLETVALSMRGSQFDVNAQSHY